MLSAQSALRCDGYAFNPAEPYRYDGHNMYLLPGTLLAIPSNGAVDVKTVPRQKLLFALRNYGGYLVADTFDNRGTINTEHGVTEESQAAYGYPFNGTATGPSAAWYADLLALFQALHVVINNSEKTRGWKHTTTTASTIDLF